VSNQPKQRIYEQFARISKAQRVLYLIYPAHFTGSAYGAGMSGKPASTIAFEKRWNALLGLDEAAFVDQLGGTAPPKPAGMDEILRFNRGRGP